MEMRRKGVQIRGLSWSPIGEGSDQGEMDFLREKRVLQAR